MQDFTAAPRAACAETVRLSSTLRLRPEGSSPKPAKDAEKKSISGSAISADSAVRFLAVVPGSWFLVPGYYFLPMLEI
jgi:hypothetical protein